MKTKGQPAPRLAPGARVTIRDEDWIIRRLDLCDDGGHALTCDGLSELVRGTSAIFLERLEDDLQTHDPARTELFQDHSDYFTESLLFLESQRLRTLANDQHIHRAHQAVMQIADYQRVPAEKGLKQVRTRLLIADGVGLGKTLEAGMLATELDIRGRGRRILVVTQKSMLTQFQKEWWARFTLPLVRLDSAGLQRIRNQIPSGHNPFNYYDKTIISMDTLKGNDEYRRYLDQSRWDIIVIDECHNVAVRKSDAGSSQRARLAKQLATKSDSLILLSATPHDGSANSFASLIWLLDPTAISDPEDYSRADLDRKDLFVRRFKKDIKGQAAGQFPEPITRRLAAQATPEEEAAFQAALTIPFTQRGERATGRQGELQRVGLQKALFSSPAAASAYARHRIDKLNRGASPTAAETAEIAALKDLLQRLDEITPEHFSKYQRLLTALRDADAGAGADAAQGARWSGQDSRDRLVIFSERIETLKWLHAQLPRAMRLKDDAFAVLDGGLSDIEQQAIVERFGQEHDPLRVLLCSDVASEGLNLHYFCHRLMHFDLPWSPMVFQQRNGRVDRFGQTQQPRIDYLLTTSRIERIKGDLRVIEVLVNKDEQISRNIGDPASILRQHSIEAEEQLVAEALADHLSAEQFEHQYIDHAAPVDAVENENGDEDDWETALFGSAPEAPPAPLPSEPHRFFPDLYAFAKQAIRRIPEAEGYRIDDDARMLRLTPPPDLKRRLRRQLPAEVLRDSDEYVLSASIGLVEEAIARAREQDGSERGEGSDWPDIQYLWPQHPIGQWLIDRVIGDIGRRRAPVIASPQLKPNECAFLMLGLIPNRKGQPLIVEWQTVVGHLNDLGHQGASSFTLEDFDTFCARAGLRERELPNAGQPLDLTALQQQLPAAVAAMQTAVTEQVKAFSATRAEEVAHKLAELDALRSAQEQQLHRRIEALPDPIRQGRQAQRQRDIEAVFSEYRQWITDSLEVEPVPFVQVLAGVVRAG
ncbi:RNA polymerase-associated protein RapA [Thiorhodovibrio winogradskyi]|uniref:RNA polymerase-associated protein RapA n=1 Tax=Thiorhodovibrio winogradskyi TaxID=77007 RepID=A0ABZ0SCX4_9GAMM|nr:DEAD/DEAH box helicase [Thiorhodovibrio winogradskyi]